MNTVNYFLAGYVAFFVMLVVFLWRVDRRLDHMAKELESLKDQSTRTS